MISRCRGIVAVLEDRREEDSLRGGLKSPLCWGLEVRDSSVDKRIDGEII